MMDIKAVIFDLDGTLVDSIEDIADANNRMLDMLNLPQHSLDKYIDWIGNGARELVVKSLPEKIQSDEPKVSYCLRMYTELYKGALVNKSKLYSGINNVLNLLEENKIPKAILTNKPHDLATGVADVLLKEWKFTHLVGQQSGNAKKPDPAEALKIAKSFGIKPEYIAFVGDSHVDIQTAMNAGMQPIAVSWGYDSAEALKKTGCKTIINTSEELLDLLSIKNITYENKSC